MNSRLEYELKIIGINPFIISIAISILFILICEFSGDLTNLSYLGFEVLFPFFTVIAICEWGGIKTDDNYDIIISQGKSLFSWIAIRFFTIFAIVTTFTLLSILAVTIIRKEASSMELMCIYFAPAFFLSTLGVICSMIFKQEHLSTLMCGTIWLTVMLLKNLLRIDGVEFFYLYIKFVGDENNIWLYNKLILIGIGLILWVGIYFKTRRKGNFDD